MKPLSKPLSIREIVRATGAGYCGAREFTAPVHSGQVYFTHICTDTRALTPGCLFVAIKGENFDGHDYIPQALAGGAAFAISHMDSDDPRVLRVKDTRRALLDVAGFYRKMIAPKVAAVTGSVGKTTTKEMTACVLEGAYKTLKTPANLNNEVGLSQTLLMLEENHGAAMLELGVDGPGQMPQLSHAAAPDVSIVTGIGVAHVANYVDGRQGIFEEKMRIRDGMPNGATLLINGDNDLLQDFGDERLRVLRYGMENPRNDIIAASLQDEGGVTSFDILWQGERYPARLPALGKHNVLNGVAAFVAGVTLGVPPEQAAQALEDYRPEGMRQRAVEHEGYTIVEDCYNASPDSMRAAFATLRDMPCKGKKIAVLSDMLELGPSEGKDHFDVGAFAGECGLDLLLCTGSLSVQYAAGAKSKGIEAAHYSDKNALFDALKQAAHPGDILWFKASRGMRLEELLTKFYREI
ncbi:MAG: UDP-N-acetylmuramoyl-tripeptide--D-alanyl-D-alanine ligase [Oscillospiraceae bacterium]|nr:UDP-N-acetylmuramoyl-tripeptide--D-alanyl-D-alanine ligase [Oscillospiraceae bacterium]